MAGLSGSLSYAPSWMLTDPYAGEGPATVPAAPPAAPAYAYGGSQVARGFRSALTGAKSAIQSYGGQLAELVGADQAAQAMNQSAVENAALAEQQAPRVRTVRQVMEGGDYLNDGLDYAAGVVGQAVPYLALGVAGGVVGRGAGLVSGMRAGVTGDALAARAATAGTTGAAAAFHPVMAGDVAAQLRDDPAAAHMGVGERALRANAVGGMQAMANAIAPAHMVERSFVRAPVTGGVAQSIGRIGAGATKTAGLSGFGEAAEDVIGQAHQMQYDPNYRFNPEQTGEAAAAGFIGAGPTSIGHAAGVEMLDTANAGAQRAGSAALGGAEQIVQVARELGGKAYDSLPAQAQDALKAVAATGQMTADAAAALAPHVDNLGSAVADVVRNFYNDTKRDIDGYRADADIGMGPSVEDVATDLYANAVTAGAQAKAEGAAAVKDFVDDPAIAAIGGPVKDFLGKAKNKLDGLTKVAEIMSDPAKWLHEGEKMTPTKLGQIKAMMNRPEAQAKYSKAVLELLDSVPMEGQSAAEVRSLAERTKAGEQLTDQEIARMYAQFKLASKAHQTAEDMAHVLKFDERLKAGQEAQDTALPTQFSRQKTKAAEDQWVKDLEARTSESFRNRVDEYITEMFNSSEVGRELLTREGGARREIDGMIDFMANVAAGKKGYDTKAAIRMATNIVGSFGDAGKAAIDNIIKAGDHEFGMDSKRAERVAGMRDSISSMHTIGADIRSSLLKNKEASLDELVKDVEMVRDTDANRESYEKAIAGMRQRAAKTDDPELRFQLMEKASDAEDELMAGGLEGLKSKWVGDGLVDAKKFDALVEAISKYAGHEDRLTKPERRKAGHATEANHAAEDLDDVEARRATAEEAGDESRPGKDKSEAEEVEAARNAERGVQGGEDRAAPIWFGTNAFEAGGHKAGAIGAPLSRHPSGDHAKGDIPGSQYNDAIEAAHAKYGHRVTRAHGVRPLAWAEEMARTEGKKSDYAYLDDAMKALLAEDQKRLKNEKLTEEDRKWIGNRAELAARLLAQQEAKGGIEKFPAAGHFFAESMNRNYRYYRMEQHDASNLSYSAEQLQAAYSVKEGETAAAYAEREGVRDGGVFDKKVYRNSLLPVTTAKGKIIEVDVAKLVTNAMKHHQAGDITGAGDKASEASFAKEILTAFHTVVAALMTGDGMHATDPLGTKDATGRVFSSEDAKNVFGEHFDPSLVVFRDPTGRVLQELGEHVKTASVRNFFTLGDLMDIQGVDVETGRTLRTEQSATKLMLKVDGKDAPQTPKAPGVFSQGDLDSVLKKVSQTSRDVEGRRDAKSREAGNERGTAYRGLTFDGVQKTVDVRALLARMIERNGIDPFEALYKGDIPEETAGHFLYEALEELKAMGFDGPLMDMAQTRFDNLVLFTREFTADDGSKGKENITFGAIKWHISTDRYKAERGEPVMFERDLRDAKLREALNLLKAAEEVENESKARTARGAARDDDNTPLGDKTRADAVTKGLKNTEFAKGQPERYTEVNALSGFDKRMDASGNTIEVPTEGGARTHVRNAKGKMSEVPARVEAGTRIGREQADKALAYSVSEIDNFRLGSLLREFGEASKGDAPLFDRSANQLFLDTADIIHTSGDTNEESTASLPKRLQLVRELLEASAPTKEGERAIPRVQGTLRERAERKAKELEARIKEMAEQAEAVRNNTTSPAVSVTRGMPSHVADMAERKTELSERGVVRADKAMRKNAKLLPEAVEGEVSKEAPLNSPSTPYEAPRIPAAVKRAAKIESKDVVTNKANLLAAAEAKRIEDVEAAKKAVAQQLRDQAKEKEGLETLKRAEASIEKPVPEKVAPATEEFDAFAKADEFAATPPKTGRETIELVGKLSDEQLRDFALALPRFRTTEGTLARQAYNVLGSDGEFGMRPMAAWAKQQRDRAGIRLNQRTGVFEEVAPEGGPGDAAFSKQRTGEKSTSPAETKEFLKKEMTRLVKDAFDLEMPETMGKDISGGFIEELNKILVSQEASDKLGTLHHEVWHGIEKLLGDMGPHGKKVLDEIYAHTSSKEMQAWLRTQYLDDGGVASQLTDKKERAAFAFQKFMAGERMPLGAATKTRWEKIKAFIAKIASKLGIETTTTGERATNFFNYVKDGSFARDMENATAVRQGLGEKNGDNLMNSAATHLKPFVEMFEKVLQHSDTRIRKLDVPEYNEILNLYAGQSGKGGYRNEYNRNINKWLAKADALVEGMDDAGKLAFLSSTAYRAFRGQLEGYMKKAGVSDKDILGLYKKLVSFNGEKVGDRMEEFITDLQLYGGLTDKGAVRKIASQIADRGYFYDNDIELFKGHDDVKDKWLERSPEARITRYIERAVYLAEQTRAFSDGKTMRGKLDALLEAGGANSTPEGRKLVEDYTKAMEGRLGEGTMSPAMKKLMGTMLFANNVTILPMAVFSQMLDPMNMAMRKNSMHGSIDALWRGVSEMPKSFDKFRGNYSKDYWETLANQVGSAPTRIVTNVMANLMNGMEINGTVGKLNETFFKYNFMDQWNRSMHVEATKHAVEFLREHSENVAKGMGGVDKDGTLRSKRFLDELGLKHTDVKFNAAGELILNDKIESAVVQYVEEAMAHPDAGSNPMWMNDPRFAMISQMKRFTFAHAKYVLGRGMTELFKGNAFPIAPMAIAMPWMMAADGLRNTLTGTEGYQATSALDEAQHLAERAGHLGRGQFAADIEGAMDRGGSPVEALLGPTAERLGNIARGLHNGNAIDAMTN